jgi:two-component system sensor histidine kinase/response regulator
MDVLIVDDSPTSLMLLEALVAGQGHSVTTCVDGESAVEVLNERCFPLIFLDWELPGMDGPDVARHIRALPGGGPVTS